MDIQDILHSIRGDISDIRVSQARTEENLSEHMRRTSAAEENLSLLRRDFQPVQEHVVFLQSIFRAGVKLGVAIIAIATLAVAILEYIK